jgi:hypothetical protein
VCVCVCVCVIDYMRINGYFYVRYFFKMMGLFPFFGIFFCKKYTPENREPTKSRVGNDQ